MDNNIPAIEELIKLFAKLPGLGPKSAKRIILKLINNKLALSVHDVSSGGLIIALAEMTFNSSNGLKLNKPKNLSNLMEYFFSEDQGRYLIEVEPDNLKKVSKILEESNIFNEIVGIVQQDYFEVPGEIKISINDLYKANNSWYNNY